EAYMWFNLSAMLGNEKAKENAAYIEKRYSFWIIPEPALISEGAMAGARAEAGEIYKKYRNVLMGGNLCICFFDLLLRG
ncbi:MAG: hypothetical protein IJR68_04225, partial [Fretibacterium sp.]|nr:hypothetical protein [Fretibacterium sp.]